MKTFKPAREICYVYGANELNLSLVSLHSITVSCISKVTQSHRPKHLPCGPSMMEYSGNPPRDTLQWVSGKISDLDKTDFAKNQLYSRYGRF